MSSRCAFASKRNVRLLGYVSASVLASMIPVAAQAATLSNPICTNNTAEFDPGSGQDIVVPPGFKVSVFKSGLNFPTGTCLSEDRCNVRSLRARIGPRTAEQMQ